MPRAFRIKRLAGPVSPAEKLAAIMPNLKLCLLRTLHCLPWTWQLGTAARGRHGGVMWMQFDPAIYVRQLAELKLDLREALAETEAHEKEIAGVVREASHLALNELEKGLKDLLRQVEEKKHSRRA
jgi:hypothetical protein